jgi:hypothetical protein
MNPMLGMQLVMNDSRPQVMAQRNADDPQCHRVEYCDDQPEDRGHHEVRSGCHGELAKRRGHLPDFRRSQAHEGLIDRVGAGQGGAVRP